MNNDSHAHERNPDSQRRFAVKIVERLREQGFEALFAGGCVRDQLLGVTPKDYDVATNAQPNEVRDCFGRKRTLEVGAAFGVIAVIGTKQEGIVEVATFREDGPYTDGRRPDAVSFCDARRDAARRDFTINGLFFDPLVGEVLDFVGGQNDLQAQVVRAIGDPAARFQEDKLRMLRAIRFAARLNYQIEPNTLAAIQGLASQIVVVSAERIAQEMRGILTGPRRALGLHLLKLSRLSQYVLPEIELSHQAEHIGSAQTPHDVVFSQSQSMLETLLSPVLPLSLVALLRPYVLANQSDGEAVAARVPAVGPICRRWKLSNKEIEHAEWLTQQAGQLFGAENAYWPRIQRLFIEEGIHDLLSLHDAEAKIFDRDGQSLTWVREKLALPPEELNPPPLVSGNDLLRSGMRGGPFFKVLLERIRDEQLLKRITTDAEAMQLAQDLWAAHLSE